MKTTWWDLYPPMIMIILVSKIFYTKYCAEVKVFPFQNFLKISISSHPNESCSTLYAVNYQVDQVKVKNNGWNQIYLREKL